MPQKLQSLAVLGGALVAAPVAWSLGGAEGTGVAAGYLLAAAVALWGIETQRRTALQAPQKVWTAFVLAFFAKFGGLVAGTLLLRFVPDLGERCDWRMFLLSYGLTALVVLVAGMPGVASAHRRESEPAPKLDSTPTV